MSYCHMGQMCIRCSPQLVKGICPDSQAGRLFAEMLDVLQEVVADHDAVNRLSWIDRSSLVILKCGSMDAVRERDPSYARDDETTNPKNDTQNNLI